MNKLQALQLRPILSSIDISKMEKTDQFNIIDDILLLDEISSEAQKQGEAALKGIAKDDKESKVAEANNLINEKFSKEEVELKKISSAAFDLILQQDIISAGGKALLYKQLKKYKK